MASALSETAASIVAKAASAPPPKSPPSASVTLSSRLSLSPSSSSTSPRRTSCKALGASSGIPGERALETRTETEALLADEASDMASRKNHSASSWVDVVNSSSKWIAVVGCAGAVLAFRNREVVWFSIGMVGNSFFAKLLKRLFQQARPETAKGKDDYGMPSSHSMSLTFLCTYATLTTLSAYGTSQTSLAISSAIVASCSFLTWLRVYGGLHSAAQVLVGGTIGLLDASMWKVSFDLFSNAMRRGVISSSFFDGSLLVVFTSVLAFAAWKEIKALRKQAPTS